MMAVLTGKIVIVCEPLITIIDDQIKQFPPQIKAAHFRDSNSLVVDQVEKCLLNIGTCTYFICLFIHSFIYLLIITIFVEH
jgi:hypothetical protein